ncbi:TRAP transporter small permease subunit [Neolewinella aurantiaca]|uniref:TRAP transporter small permease subunit n=1 Tax=Neolewinella aurantiaca TaxID=2602767 RepID=A0A5C7FSD0_9BACT|nr:TRAP transporter small permease subunit [Neolewinella aurantiaca]TXF88378.1 TRAP transporter small permease subunit [Neolewinella aurantiaca]
MKAVALIESIVATIGKAAGYLNLLLIFVIVVDVSLRAIFNQTAAWVGELSWHLFAMIFLLGIPYTLQQDRHVRVDLFYEKFSPANQRLVNLVGTLLFLLPWAIVLLFTGWNFAAEALASGEGSPNPNGITSFFPIKAMIPLTAALLILQGIASCVRAYSGQPPEE